MFGKKNSKIVIGEALGAFTTAKTQLDEGIELGKEEAAAKTEEIANLSTDLKTIEVETAKAVKVRDNIAKLLGE